MITVKTEKEIKRLAYSGHILAEILQQVVKMVKPGVKTIELDRMAENLIRQSGGRPSFKNYQNHGSEPPFPTALCTSVNHQVVHAPAGEQVLQAGDIIGIDIGMEYESLYTDMAVTVPVGKISKVAKKLLKVTKTSLELAIAQVKPGNYISDLSRAVQTYVEKNGLTVVRDLVGHGVGYKAHEEPWIPNYTSPSQPEIKLEPGTVLAIEPMVNLGTHHIKTLNDGWTIVTADGKLSAHFEHTVAVTKNGYLILTK